MCQRAVHHKKPFSISMRQRAVSYVSTGLARLPRDTNPFASTAEVRL